MGCWRWTLLCVAAALRDIREELQKDSLQVTSSVYRNEAMSAQLQALLRSEIGCGTPLRKVVHIPPERLAEMRHTPGSFFSMFQDLYATGPGWPHGEAEGKVIKVGASEVGAWINQKTVKEIVENHLFKLLRSTPLIELEFGTDLRSCWGDMLDFGDRPVCDNENLRELMQDIKESSKPETDDVGKSGAAIVTNLRRFVIKNFQENEDPLKVREVLPHFKKSIEERADSTCFGTGIAPVCAVLDLLDTEGGRVSWYVMRKIELPNEREAFQLQVGKEMHSIGFQDLKGPKFASIRDGKSWLAKKTSDKVWRYKDAGFVQLFPKGLELKPCGSKEVARTLQLDSVMLEEQRSTDYSLFLAPYKIDSRCSCGSEKRWPLVLDAEADGRQFRLAVGIIDFLESSVSRIDKLLGFSMSTMKKPAMYQDWWMRMWPSYFHLHGFSIDKGKVSGSHVQQLHLGDRVVALQKIKWTRRGPQVRYKLNGESEWLRCYHSRLEETKSYDIVSGSDFKIYPGEFGTVVSFETCLGADGLQISWDKYKAKLRFEVAPDSVMLQK